MNVSPPSINIKTQGLPGTRRIFLADTIRNIDINLYPKSLSY